MPLTHDIGVRIPYPLQEKQTTKCRLFLFYAVCSWLNEEQVARGRGQKARDRGQGAEGEEQSAGAEGQVSKWQASERSADPLQ